MIMIDNTTAVVNTPADLSNAISVDNGIDYVYLSDNIIMTSGIQIHSVKTSLVIDGHYPPESVSFHKLTDAGGNGQIYVSSSPQLDLTFRNLIIEGSNLYGMPYVHNYTNAQNVTVIYQNVTYSGPQMIYHQQGLTRFINCNVTISGTSGNEVGEVCKVEIGGLTIIRKTNNANAIFWFYGNSTRRTYLKILSGADVTITTAHYFMYEYYPPDYIIEENASFTLNTNSGISWNSGHTVASFLVSENASFKYTQIVNDRNVSTLYLDGALTVSEGSNFYMQADFVNTNRLIQFTGNSGGLYINNPRSFALYNRGNSSATAFSFASLIPFVLEGNQVNYWESSTDFPNAGTFEDIPMHKWKRPNWNQFKIEGRADSSNTYIDYHNFTQEELENMPLLTDLKLHLAKVFSVGNLPLSVNRIVMGTRRITGRTAKKARVRASCIVVWYCPDCDADDTGIFSATSIDPVPSDEILTVTSNTPFLLTSLMVESQEEGGLSILDAPTSITFVTPPIVGFSDIILPRQVPEISVIVLDERAERTEWVIWAKIMRPLQTEENDVLDDAVVFLREEELITLGTEFMPVHTDGPYLDVDERTVTWDSNSALLARITVPIRSGKKYSTQLGWVIYPTGVRPEEGV